MPDELDGLSEAARAQVEALARKLRMADAVFTELGVPAEWDEAVFRTLDARLRELTDESAVLKGEIEVIREKRRDVIRRMEPLIMARARLVELRPAQPGDVVVGGGA